MHIIELRLGDHGPNEILMLLVLRNVVSATTAKKVLKEGFDIPLMSGLEELVEDVGTVATAWEMSIKELGKKLGADEKEREIWEAVLAVAPEMGLSAEMMEELFAKAHNWITTNPTGKNATRQRVQVEVPCHLISPTNPTGKNATRQRELRKRRKTTPLDKSDSVQELFRHMRPVAYRPNAYGSTARFSDFPP